MPTFHVNDNTQGFSPALGIFGQLLHVHNYVTDW